MLQLILAVLTILLVAASGLGVFTQLQVQEVLQHQSETVRRLDMAARAIEGRVYQDSGSGLVIAPTPIADNSGRLSLMPAGTGAVNRSANETPFTYCPVIIKAGAAPKVNLDVPEAIRSGLNDAAVLMAPTYSKDQAPSVEKRRPACSDLTVDHGKIIAPGAFVRVVNSNVLPSEIGSEAQLETALSTFNPSSETPTSFVLKDGVTFAPSADVWSKFTSKLQVSVASVTFVGGTLIAPATAGAIAAPSSLIFDGVQVQNVRVLVRAGNVVTVNNARFAVSGSDPVFVVASGGRLTLSGSVGFIGPVSAPIRSFGDVVLTGAAVQSTSEMAAALILEGGSRLLAQNSQIGDPDSRVGSSTIVDSGAYEIRTDAVSRVVAASSGNCWLQSMPAFKFSTALNSAVEQGAPEPDRNDPSYDAWVVDKSLRDRARIVNQSAFSCV